MCRINLNVFVFFYAEISYHVQSAALSHIVLYQCRGIKMIFIGQVGLLIPSEDLRLLLYLRRCSVSVDSGLDLVIYLVSQCVVEEMLQQIW